MFCARSRNDFNRSSTRTRRKTKVILFINIWEETIRGNNRKHRGKRNNINFSFPRACSLVFMTTLFFSYKRFIAFPGTTKGRVIWGRYSQFMNIVQGDKGWMKISFFSNRPNLVPIQHLIARGSLVNASTLWLFFTRLDAFTTFFRTLPFIPTI